MGVGALLAAGLVELALLGAVRTWLARARRAPDRQRRHFEEAAAEARRLAFQVRIADARQAELTELAVEQARRELGRTVGPEPS
ncbi:MAG TPA: hypothetical protein VK386_10895 [Acidimicrobiales bacterium]|nr:hypothetical protein [Acidimicrobiales bacterium]